MPRKKLIRRFEPRYGVSQQMLEMEAKYVGREMEDYLLLSANDLQERLTRLRQEWTQADCVLENTVAGLGEREKLAVQCLIVRQQGNVVRLSEEFYDLIAGRHALGDLGDVVLGEVLVAE